jgi:hypothetical protein
LAAKAAEPRRYSALKDISYRSVALWIAIGLSSSPHACQVGFPVPVGWGTVEPSQLPVIMTSLKSRCLRIVMVKDELLYSSMISTSQHYTYYVVGLCLGVWKRECGPKVVLNPIVIASLSLMLYNNISAFFPRRCSKGNLQYLGREPSFSFHLSKMNLPLPYCLSRPKAQDTGIHCIHDSSWIIIQPRR